MNVTNLQSKYGQKLYSLANGYAKSMFDNIPMELIEIIACYLLISMRFYEEKYGGKMEIDAENDSVKMTDRVVHWSSIVFGTQPISINVCNKFRIKFLWKHKTMSFFMGFIRTKDIANCSFNWDSYIGACTQSLGILIHSHSTTYDLFTNIEDYDTQDFEYTSTERFGKYQTFELLFDFVESKITIFHGKKEADTIFNIKLDNIFPAISMYRENEEIQIVEYEFF